MEALVAVVAQINIKLFAKFFQICIESDVENRNQKSSQLKLKVEVEIGFIKIIKKTKQLLNDLAEFSTYLRTFMFD